jgi:hypothetical protein
MSRVRVLVGTRKGAFVLTADGKRHELGRLGPALSRAGRSSPEGFALQIQTGSTHRSRARGSDR